MGCFIIEQENYEEIKDALKQLIELFENLNEVEFQDTTYKIEYFLGGDLKFLALVLGLKLAMAKHPCIWCVSEKKSFVRNLHDHNSFRVLEGK